MKKQDHSGVDLLHGKVGKALLLFAIPIIISNLFQQLYNTADTMLVGRALGEGSLAAIGSCTSINDLMIGFGFGVGNGLGVVTARAYGSGKRDLLRRSVAGALVIEAIMILVIMGGGSLFLHRLLHLLGTPEEILEEAFIYIVTIALGCSAMLLFNLFSGMLRAIGNSLMPLVFLVAASVMNVILDIVLIPVMGVRGAAVATVLAQGLSAFLCLVYILKRAPILIPKREDFRVDARLYKELAAQGLAMGFMSAIVSSGSIILQSSINAMGTLIIAGHTAARRLFMFAAMLWIAFAGALSTFASQNYGAGQPERVRKAVKGAFFLFVGWSAAVTILMFLAAPQLVALLCGSKDATIIATGSRYMRFTGPFLWIAGNLSCLRNTLQGLGEKRIPILTSIIELVGKILFTMAIVPRMGYNGVIICEPIIWIVMTSVLFYSYKTNAFLYPNRKAGKAEMKAF